MFTFFPNRIVFGWIHMLPSAAAVAMTHCFWQIQSLTEWRLDWDASNACFGWSPLSHVQAMSLRSEATCLSVHKVARWEGSIMWMAADGVRRGWRGFWAVHRGYARRCGGGDGRSCVSSLIFGSQFWGVINGCSYGTKLMQIDVIKGQI
jgi:hypothetical protein